MKAADLSQPVTRKREGKVRWCKSAAFGVALAVMSLLCGCSSIHLGKIGGDW
jgi:hypothetical protein